MLQPTSAPLRRHFLPGVKVEYSVSPRQSAYRVQIHRIQVREVKHRHISVPEATFHIYFVSDLLSGFVY